MPPAPARDADGVVIVSDADFEKLRVELGEQELNRVITYLGGYCASNGKRFKDWPATIRRAAREGWGKKPAGKGAQAGTSPGTDTTASTDRVQQNNEWLKQFLAEQEAKEGSNGQ